MNIEENKNEFEKNYKDYISFNDISSYRSED